MMNKNLKYNLIAIGLVTGISILASQNTLSRPMFGMHEGNAKSSNILERMDYNTDGIVTEEDLLNRMLERGGKRFERQNSNDDDLLSLEEFSTKPGRFENIDHDAVRACVTQAIENDLSTGNITSLAIRPSHAEAFVEADSNNDGFIDTDEYGLWINNRAAERFGSMDVDSDGTLSETEMQTALENHSQLRQLRRDCISEQGILAE